MIKYALWDQTNLISNKFLRHYIRDTFYELNLEFSQDISIHHDLEHLIEDADCSHLVVFRDGHTLRDSLKFRKAIEKLCKIDFLVAGHLIHHVNAYPFIHPQMFVLNIPRYNALGRPFIGYYEDTEVLDLHLPERSPDNIHDDYTPLWLKPTDEIQTVMRRDFGWNLIHTSLKHGLPVLNLPDELRWSKRYLYPNDKPHLFASYLESVSKDEPIDLSKPNKLNYNQIKHLEEICSPGSTSRIYLMNTEKLTESIPNTTNIKKIFGVASGLKLFFLWTNCSHVKDVIYFDHNKESLRIWEDVIKNWSGLDFPGFCRDRGYIDDFSRMPEVIRIFGNEFTLQQAWKQYQTCNFEFVFCDILTNPELLIKRFTMDGNLIWFSNCFNFYEGIRRYGLQGCEDRRKKFMELITKTDQSAVLIPKGTS